MIHVEIEDAAWSVALPEPDMLATRAADAALLSTGLADRSELALLLTNDAAVRELNLRFRGLDKPTNVLSFPAAETARPHLGDIALGYGVCAAEAQAQAKPLGQHLAHLVVHGVLHLVGYDHQADSDAAAMEDKERAILRELGVPDPYAPQREPHA